MVARAETMSEGGLGRRFDVPPPRVDRPAMLHRWERLAFVHWRYPAEDVQRLLPDGLAVDIFDGAAWVGLVPFSVSIAAPRVPVIPWMARFLEINVRTYVTGPARHPGGVVHLSRRRTPGGRMRRPVESRARVSLGQVDVAQSWRLRDL